MDESALKERLRREVGAPSADAFEIVWEDLVEAKRVKDAIEDGELGYADLLEEARRQVRLVRRTLEEVGSYSMRLGRPVGSETSEEAARVDVSDYELMCARINSEYLSIRASKRPDVLQFRAYILGGARPTGDETDEDLASLATAGLLGGDEALALVNTPEHHAAGGPWLSYAEGDRAEVFRVEVRLGSVLDRLRDCAEKLAADLPWHVADGARWLVTGVPVEVTPLSARTVEDGAVIAVSARPFVDARTATALYHRAQRRLRGGDNRPVSERACAVLLFVSERTSRRGERPSWGKLLEEWNRSRPAPWAFKDRAGFMRAYVRAHRALLGKEAPPDWRKGIGAASEPSSPK